MRRLCLPPDTRKPEEKPYGDRTFGDCAVVFQQAITAVEGLPPDRRNDEAIWMNLRLRLQDAAVKYTDTLGWDVEALDSTDLLAVRQGMAKSIELLPVDADPRLRHWLETVPQVMLNCNTPDELERSLTAAIAEATAQD